MGTSPTVLPAWTCCHLPLTSLQASSAPLKTWTLNPLQKRTGSSSEPLTGARHTATQSEVNVTIRSRKCQWQQPPLEKWFAREDSLWLSSWGSYHSCLSDRYWRAGACKVQKSSLENELGFFYLNPDSGVLVLKVTDEFWHYNGNFALRSYSHWCRESADPMSINISVPHGKAPKSSVAEKLVWLRSWQRSSPQAKANGKLNLEDGFLDFYSKNWQGPRLTSHFLLMCAAWESASWC